MEQPPLHPVIQLKRAYQIGWLIAGRVVPNWTTAHNHSGGLYVGFSFGSQTWLGADFVYDCLVDTMGLQFAATFFCLGAAAREWLWVTIEAGRVIVRFVTRTIFSRLSVCNSPVL